MLEKQALRQARADLDISEAETQLADRLDRLSAPMAENVLKRAIEMHQDEQFDDDDGSVSFDEVAKIASELGIDTSTLRKALLAELDTDQVAEESLFDRLFVPKRITGGIVADADASVVANQVDEWMREVEGMYPTSASNGQVKWEEVRAGGRLTGALKLAGIDGAVSRQNQLGQGEQLVEIDIDLAELRRAGIAFALLGMAIGAVGGTFTAALESFAPGIVEFLLPFAGASAVGLGVGVLHAKTTARRVRNQVNRTLKGIVDLGRRGRNKGNSAASGNPSWKDIVNDA